MDIKSIQWVSKGEEQVPAWRPPSWLRLQPAPAGKSLRHLLETGELDAQILSDTSFVDLAGNNLIRRLWPNYREIEASYYRRTGIFPIRHVMVLKNELLQRDSQIPRILMRLFEEAKQHAYRYWADHRRSYLAWFGAEQEEERALLGRDPWPYSIENNRVVLDTLLDYAVEQGLTDRRLNIEEIFAPAALV